MANNRKLGRATDHRMAMLRALVTYLLENGKVETTLARAKVKPTKGSAFGIRKLLKKLEQNF